MFELVKDENNIARETLEKLSRDNKARIILYGAGYCGYEALQQMNSYGIKVASVCDDGRVGQYIDGYEITDISEISPTDDLRIFITSGFNKVMKDRLNRLGLLQYYEAVDFGRYEPEKENYDFFKQHEQELEECYSLLKDERSKEVFVRLVQYRISRNPRYIRGMMEHTPQYFPEQPDLHRSNHVFMDLGAYNGDTIEGFITYMDGKYEKIYGIEASGRNFQMMKENCKSIRDVDFINIGISDSRKRILFNISDAKNSFADAKGTEALDTDSVDNILAGRPVTFIKMDIEGAEYDAINGARGTIKSSRPIMAVSIYHQTEDLFRLQLEIERILPNNYDYYIRHYSPTIIETILYAVPKEDYTYKGK